MPHFAPVSSAKSLGDLVTERESRGEILEHFGLDFCCGGKKSLEVACAELNLRVDDVVRALEEADQRTPVEGSRDWTKATLRDLADHIVGTHHVYLRSALPELEVKVRKVAEVHGAHHPELLQVRDTFLMLKREIEAHMEKEEDVVFPAVKAAEAKRKAGDVAAAMKELEDEHVVVGDALHKIRALTNSYAVPDDACPTYRSALKGLSALEMDTHHHVHKENNILLPRARRLLA